MLTSSDPLEFVKWYLHEYYPQVKSNPCIPDNLADLEKRLNEVILYWYIARYCLQDKQLPPFTDNQITQIREYMEMNAETALPVAVKAVVCENSDNWIDNLGMDYVDLTQRIFQDVPGQIFGVFGQIPERLMPDIWNTVQWIETRRGNMIGVQKASLEGRRSITELHEKYVYPLAGHGKTFKEAGKLPRQDALGEILEGVVKEYASEHGKLPQWNQVVGQLETLASEEHRVIQEVDREVETIYWRRKGGMEEKTTFKQLRERLTLIRKKNSKSKFRVID